MTIPAGKVRFQVTLPRELKDRIDATADALALTPSAVISVYLMQALPPAEDHQDASNE